ncbi:MAG: hypothetical protein ACI9VS_003911 [Candidatus Binatia bacterium]|jgi:hypothetical protein
MDAGDEGLDFIFWKCRPVVAGLPSLAWQVNLCREFQQIVINE